MRLLDKIDHKATNVTCAFLILNKSLCIYLHHIDIAIYTDSVASMHINLSVRSTNVLEYLKHITHDHMNTHIVS